MDLRKRLGNSIRHYKNSGIPYRLLSNRFCSDRIVHGAHLATRAFSKAGWHGKHKISPCIIRGLSMGPLNCYCLLKFFYPRISKWFHARIEHEKWLWLKRFHNLHLSFTDANQKRNIKLIKLSSMIFESQAHLIIHHNSVYYLVYYVIPSLFTWLIINRTANG